MQNNAPGPQKHRLAGFHTLPALSFLLWWRHSRDKVEGRELSGHLLRGKLRQRGTHLPTTGGRKWMCTEVLDPNPAPEALRITGRKQPGHVRQTSCQGPGEPGTEMSFKDTWALIRAWPCWFGFGCRMEESRHVCTFLNQQFSLLAARCHAHPRESTRMARSKVSR